MEKKTKVQQLRKKAEQLLKEINTSSLKKYEGDVATLLEELSIHQIELEMQNDELVKTQQTLETERKRYKHLYENTPIPYITLNVQGNIIYTNYAAANLFSMQQHLFRYNSIFPFIAFQSKNNFRKLITKAFNEKTIIEGQVTFITKEKKAYPSKLNLSAYFDNENNEDLCLITITDILSEENAIQESREKYEELAQNIKEGIYSTENGIFTTINNAFVKMFGYTEAELIGMPAWHLAKPEMRETVKQKFFEKVKKQDNTPLEVECIKKDGTLFWAEISISSFYNQEKIFGIVADITQKKEAERKLKENQKKYRFLYENSHDLICLHDLEGNYIELSPSVTQLLGYTQEELLGKNPYELFHPDDIEQIKKESHEKALNNKTVKITYRIQKKDGSYLWFETITDTIQKNNQPQYLMTSSRDVTETVLATQKLNKTNKALKDFLGYTSYSMNENLLDKMALGVHKILHADIAFIGMFTDKNKNKIKTISLYVDGKISDNIEYDLKHTPCNDVLFQDACSFPCDIQKLYPEDYLLQQLEIEGYIGIPLYSSKKEPVGIIVALYRNAFEDTDFYRYILHLFASQVGVEIERQKAENNLKKSEEKYRQLFNFMPIGISISDKDGNLIDGNIEAERLLGVHRDEHKNRQVDSQNWSIIRKDGSIMPPEEFASVRALAENKLIENVEMGIVKTPTITTWLNVTATPLNYQNGVVIAYIDISERIKKEKQIEAYTKQLKELNASKDKFFSIIAHDLKNPFSTILGYSDLLLENFDHYSVKDKKQFIQSISNSSQQTYKLLENLLIWSRAQTNRVAFNPQTINVNNLIDNNITLSANSAQAKNISLKKEGSTDLYAQADYEMINTVFRNLLSNAIKFTSRNGSITIGSKNAHEKDRIICYISDTGIGISKENQKKIFNIDQNYSRTGTNNEKGTGLGLILCKEFIEKNNGKIWVESEKDKGSTFYFTLKKSPDYSQKVCPQNCIQKTQKITELINNNEKLKTYFTETIIPLFDYANKKITASKLEELTTELLSISKIYQIKEFIMFSETVKNSFSKKDLNQINICFTEFEQIVNNFRSV